MVLGVGREAGLLYCTEHSEVQDAGREAGKAGERPAQERETGLLRMLTCVIASGTAGPGKAGDWGGGRGELRVRRDMQASNLESVQRFPAILPLPHQTYANGNNNKLR